ncbi:MAG: TonB-dependent receptor [Acidobacteria bacterium]|nr:TonB-dependent receptor [Acidobacteriota bacterium]
MYAQDVRATLNGRVQDASGAAIPNASVTVVNTATGVETTVTSSGDGNYTVPFLVPGPYTVRATASGFKSTERANVQLHVGDKITVDLNLPIGETSETITVSAAPPLLDEGTASRSGLIDNVRVTELPVVGRNPINYANLLPGVTFQGNPQFIRPFDNGDNANFSINGGLRQTNAFLLDGAPDDAISDTAGDRSHANQNVAYIPTNEATLEFKIVNNFYDAQYGRTGGGIFNISTKVGTNDFHGVGYYFMRRYQLDANTIQNKVAHLPRYAQDPVTKANIGGQKIDQYGFVLDGPVVIPHMYNGKDKTFFMFGWENYYEASPSPTLTTVPSIPERNGDFSHSGINIYDPYTTALDAFGNCCTRTQFAGNIIPAARLANSAGFKIAQAYPAPNYAASGDPLTNPVSANNYSTGANLSEDHYRNWIARVDQNFGQRERIYGRYAFARRKQVDNGSANYQGPLIDAQDPLGRTNHNAVLDSITSFGPHITMDLRASFTRYDETVARTRSSLVDITTLGYSSGFANSRFTNVVPHIQIQNTAGGIPDAGSRNPRFGISNITGFQPGVQMIYGKHSIHVGADLRDIRYNTGGGSFVYGSGNFVFNANLTQQNPNATYTSSQGSGIASLLLGTPASGVIQYTPRLGYRWRYSAFYVQDDWKISQRLTLNLGLRYDIEGSPTEQANRQNRGFAFDSASPLAAAAASASPSTCPSCSALKGGLLFAGTGGQPKGAFNTQYGNIQPRFGAVFRATNSIIVRGGYGMFYLPEAAFGAAQGFAQDTAFIPTQSGSSVLQNTPRGSASAPPLNDPFTTGILQPTGSSAGLATFQGQNIIFNNVDRKIPRAQQYSVGIQQQFPGSIKFDVSYVGSRTDHVNTNDNQVGGARNLNVLSNQQIAAARAAALTGGPGGVQVRASDYVTQAVANPFAGLIPGSSLNFPTVSRQQLLVPYPQFPFNGVSIGQESVGKVWYDSLQLLVEKRYTHGFTLMGAYTWSKTQEALAFLNNQDAKPFKNLSAADRTNRLVISGVLELPFGRNHAFLSHANRAMELLVGGWSLNLIETIQTGTPVDLNGAAYAIRDPRNGTEKSFNQYFNTCVQRAPVFNTTTHTYNAPETKDRTGATCSNPAWIQINTANLDLRQTPFRASYVRSPNAPNADLSASKKFNITDRVAAQFRFETFNLTNTAIRGNPNMDPNSSNFGLVGVSQANQARRVQLGFRALF